MQKWAGMLVETGKAFVDPSAMTTQMREVLDFLSLPALTILCWRTLFAITKHPENGPDIARMNNTTTRLTALCRIQGYKLAVQCLTVNECNQSGCGVVHLGYARSIFRMLRDDQKCSPTQDC